MSEYTIPKHCLVCESPTSLCCCDDGPVMSVQHGVALLAELAALRADAAIGQLVRRRLVGGDAIAFERCHVTAAEVAAIDARKEAP